MGMSSLPIPDFTEQLRAWVPRSANRGRYLAGGGEQSLKIVLAVFKEEVKFSEGRIAPLDTYERGGLRGRPFFMPRGSGRGQRSPRSPRGRARESLRLRAPRSRCRPPLPARALPRPPRAHRAPPSSGADPPCP